MAKKESHALVKDRLSALNLPPLPSIAQDLTLATISAHRLHLNYYVNVKNYQYKGGRTQFWLGLSRNLDFPEWVSTMTPMPFCKINVQRPGPSLSQTFLNLLPHPFRDPKKPWRRTPPLQSPKPRPGKNWAAPCRGPPGCNRCHPKAERSST